jgi:crossover junction endodeoxyribonuclease RuvC
VRVRVLGIDPGTMATGYGLVEQDDREMRLLECGVIRPRRDLDLTYRLLEIHQALLELIDRLEPSCLAVEGVFAGHNARSSMVLGQARGVTVLTGALRGLEVLEYPPAEVKKTVVGSGRATKEQVGLMVQQHLRLESPPTPSDAADGCAIALCHLLQAVVPRPPASDRPARSRGTNR